MHSDFSTRKLLYALAFISTASCAAEVELAGIFGSRAVLVIDGGAPQTLSVGQRSREGIKLVSVSNPTATVDVNGEQPRVRQLRSQVLVFARAHFQKCHYNSANCSGAAGFPIPSA